MTAVVLNAVAGPIVGQTWSFDQHDTFIFGRAPDCHAQLDPSDSTASRHHFILEVQPPLVTIRDLGSRNGTFVNGENIAARSVRLGPQVLHDGDEVKVGHTRFVIRVSGSVKRKQGLQLVDLSDLAGDTEDRDRLPADSTQAPSTESQPEDELPSVDGFVLHARLGAGGMGKVYRATDAHGRMVALKILRAQVAKSSANRAIFLREIESLTQFDHPRIVRIHSSGHLGRTYWLAMELCPNGSLETRAFGEKFRGDWRIVAGWVLDALEGLAVAHKQGLVHRDVKPANILIDADHRGKIADFGLAKSVDNAGMAGLTLSGQFAGTYEFMPREQLTQFKTMLPMSDVYSAGASLYWALSGKPPVEFTQGLDPLTNVLRANVVSLADRRPELPGSLCRVVDMACSRDACDRYEDGQAFYEALAAVILR